MDTKYVIEGQTLTAIADSIREMEGHTDPVPVDEFAKRITGVEPIVVEYMRITDFLDYPEILDPSDYTQEEIARCTELYRFYLEMEDITNG